MKVFIYASFVFSVLILASCGTTKKATTEGVQLKENTSHLQNPDLAPFYHGLASGDPFQNSVVIWTRITPAFQIAEIAVDWEVSLSRDFKKILQAGKYITTPKQDYTVKVIVEDLLPGTQYYYRFRGLDSYSKVGAAKTLPAGSEVPINLAFVSCSNIEFGYFNAYAALAEDDLDAVIHLGDYIYEYGPDKYGDPSFFRKNIPAHEIISLQDYRDRYSQYRLDEDLQKIHGQVPFINIWDDHEITNNAYISGAQNHQENEGSYDRRKAVAKQVFYEWLPIREGKTHYRKFNFGNTIDLVMLDERLAGRTMQADSLSDPRRNSDDHHLLGDVQMEWLISALKDSKATWKIIGNQVIFSYTDWAYENFSQNMDAWDGYPKDQDYLSRAIKQGGLENIIFVTGDTHTAWAFEATSDPFRDYDKDTGEGAVGIEFGVTSISSANANESTPNEEVRSHEGKISNSDINPHLKYVNMRDHGYLKLIIDKDELTAEFKSVTTLKERNSNTLIDRSYKVKKGSTKLIQQGQ